MVSGLHRLDSYSDPSRSPLMPECCRWLHWFGGLSQAPTSVTALPCCPLGLPRTTHHHNYHLYFGVFAPAESLLAQPHPGGSCDGSGAVSPGSVVRTFICLWWPEPIPACAVSSSFTPHLTDSPAMSARDPFFRRYLVHRPAHSPSRLRTLVVDATDRLTSHRASRVNCVCNRRLGGMRSLDGPRPAPGTH